MEYKCKTIGIDRLNVTPVGFVKPLCDTCVTKDCTNPIESMNYSVLGVTRKMRLYNKNSSPVMVVECEGYIGRK